MSQATTPADAALDTALEPLTGRAFYRNNIFRITGLAPDAPAAQVRRRREEAALAARLGTPFAAPAGDLPLDPPPDPDDLRGAFESLRDPVIRFVHEMLWLWDEERPGDTRHEQHNAAIRAHCAALESADPGAAANADSWAEALRAWAGSLEDEQVWERAYRRARELDDPRLTIGTVRKLRYRLPAHIVSATVSLAVRDAEDGDEAGADRYLELLDDSPFDDDLVDRMLRDAVRGREERIGTACREAENMAGSDPKRSLAAGEELISRTRLDLLVVETLLGRGDSTTDAVYDAVAVATNLCAVSYWKATSEHSATMPLLRAALERARDTGTIELIKGNIEVIEPDAVIEEASGVLKSVYGLCQAGKVDAARDRLMAWRGRTRDETLRRQLSTVLADPRAIRGPVARAPRDLAPFGIGTTTMGMRDFANDGSYIATRWFLLFIPIVPLASYHQDARFVYGKVPLRPAARTWRTLVLLALLYLFVDLVDGDGAWHWLAVAVAAGSYLLTRFLRVNAWVRIAESR
ncbi:hypothetical protein [Amycolatopsis suaedae]|uniref:Uncharacterized protein n=1 Tax=Amycolatopsis suaedae TaxID=2510978 RepID=A0A4Q7J1N9_9PSEU|nr:hypothetical protein [Amycolatopsis suaedae]RZQ60492.1 hypothetical protein EWH70_27810 [Amycolatopsis suaedae]